MDDITKKTIEKLVLNFISEMNEWEKYCNELDQNTQLAWDEADRMMEQRVASIINKYCTDKERKMSRPNAISWGVEGSYVYDPNKEKIMRLYCYTYFAEKILQEGYLSVAANPNPKQLPLYPPQHPQPYPVYPKFAFPE